ncbi:MAG: hypothetical protein ABIC96_01420 [Patescibacteria group bacterium]
MHPEDVGKKISRVGTVAAIGTASILAPGCIPSKESFPSPTPIVEKSEQGMPSLSPTPTPKPTETPAPSPTAESTKTPTPLPTPSPTELPKTPTKVPIPEDNISKETAQFVEWSPQKVDQTLHEAWEKGEFKTVINWDVNKGGWELKKMANPYDSIHGSSLVLFLPEGEIFTFYSVRTGEIYGAGSASSLSYIDVKSGEYRVQQVFPLNGEVLVKIDPKIKVGDQIFRLRFIPDSPEQKKFETKVAKGAAVDTAFPDKTVKGNYRYLQLEHLLTDEQGRLVVLNPDLGAK